MPATGRRCRGGGLATIQRASGKRMAQAGPPAAVNPAAAFAARRRSGYGASRRRERPAVAGEQREIDAKPRVQPVDRLLLRRQSGVGRRQMRGKELSRHLERLIGGRLAGRKAPQRAGGQHHHATRLATMVR